MGRDGRIVFEDKQTVNVLVLELATMVVAIALAFSSTLLSAFTFGQVLSFMFTNLVVIWFWWSYVVDRLTFPPRTMEFPLFDILILILIALLPFALHSGAVYPLSGIVGVMLIIWGLMIRSIRFEYAGRLAPATDRELREEVWQRVSVGPVFIAIGVWSFYSPLGVYAFVSVAVFIVAWSVITRRTRAPARS